jgi:hypothetical protein
MRRQGRQDHGTRGNSRGRAGHELWGKRPFSYWSHTAENKRMCRRHERRVGEPADIRERIET